MAMKKVLLFCTLGTLALAATGVVAQIDPQVNSIGIYGDSAGTTNCLSPDELGPLDVYLCLTNITDSAGVLGWECKIEWTPGFFILGWALHGTAINALDIPEFGVGLAAPLPFAPSITVMTITVGVYTGDPIELFVKPVELPSVPGSASYVGGSDPDTVIALRNSTGNPDNPSCTINGDCPVPDEEFSWGFVKSLYR
jgi:hypothetical protein